VSTVPTAPSPTGPSRRALLRGGAVVGLAAAVGGGAVAAAGVSYAETAATRQRAFAAPRQRRMPTSTRLLWRARTEQRVAALTFDDGPDPRFTEPLLDVLEREQVRATFFVCGAQAERHPDLVRRQADAGHEVGNHTWGHTDLAMLDHQAARRELTRTTEVVTALTGSTPSVLRPPWGRISGTAMQVAAEMSMDVMVWDVRLLDKERDEAGNVEHVLEHLAPGMVLLGHDAGAATRAVGLAAMPEVIRRVKERGFRFVTASEMLALDETVAPS
jgi:peptidoglycan/xylan/chitin deacetylase (PgdA/CDA1 family)